MLRIGLTGGLASGKSFVALALHNLGCYLIQADELGHQVMQKEAEAYSAILDEFGPQILTPNQEIDRRKLGQQVFQNPDQLKKLSAIVHPAVRARALQLEESFKQQSPHGIIVYEAAILVETGSFRDYERLIVASCTEEQQIERAVLRDHFTREEVLSRLRRQMPLEEKVKYADYVIDTSGTKEHTLDQTRTVYASLRRLEQEQL
ncbi:MAG TPA: dephospho-CoA kinase [Bryobacteraceae bacterium]|jgi:dephospho-CoA kinase|nr:dephospho-CoA kinase [Bryobacteraceae bacterium]